MQGRPLKFPTVFDLLLQALQMPVLLGETEHFIPVIFLEWDKVVRCFEVTHCRRCFLSGISFFTEIFCTGTQLIVRNTKTGSKHLKGVVTSPMTQVSHFLHIRNHNAIFQNVSTHLGLGLRSLTW